MEARAAASTQAQASAPATPRHLRSQPTRAPANAPSTSAARSQTAPATRFQPTPISRTQPTPTPRTQSAPTQNIRIEDIRNIAEQLSALGLSITPSVDPTSATTSGIAEASENEVNNDDCSEDVDPPQPFIPLPGRYLNFVYRNFAGQPIKFTDTKITRSTLKSLEATYNDLDESSDMAAVFVESFYSKDLRPTIYEVMDSDDAFLVKLDCLRSLGMCIGDAFFILSLAKVSGGEMNAD